MDAKETAYECLGAAWRSLRDDASPLKKAFIRGAIEMAHQTGVITGEQSELWMRRIETCPGHDDEGGRDWCAYCGTMPREGKE